jgi:serine/threonine protein phosphatase PrpC
MPTRSIGDFFLKHEKFQMPYGDQSMGYRPPFIVFTPPYIDYQPDIQQHTITPTDEYIILGSDGIWD